MSGQGSDGVLVEEKPTLGGLGIFASAGPPREPMPIEQDQSILDWVETPEPDRKWWQKWRRLSRTVQYQCGHWGIRPERFKIRIYGGSVTPNPKKALEHCPDCCVKQLRREAIRCCLCGFYILPHEPIAAYDAGSVVSKSFSPTVVDGSAIGCMRWNCCPSGGFFAGHWNGTSADWLTFD